VPVNVYFIYNGPDSMWSAQAWRQNSLFGKALETTAMQRPHASAGWISTLEARPSLIQGRHPSLDQLD
jgi:hypothetical protein